jgi:FKBP-type peptidyl-prolyl cis-trans isomerase FkpA
VIPRGNLSEAVFKGRISEYFKVQTEAVKKQNQVRSKSTMPIKIKATVTASGLNYEITKPGAGPNIAVMGDTAVVNYTGKTVRR